MSYLALAKKVEKTLEGKFQHSLGKLMQNLNIAVLLEIFGQEIWLIPHEKAVNEIGEDQIYFLPNEIEFLHRMPESLIKGIFLIKKIEPKIKLVDCINYQ